MFKWIRKNALDKHTVCDSNKWYAYYGVSLFMSSKRIWVEAPWYKHARRARIALLPFWAVFWVKNPFCNGDILKVPFLSQKIHLFALFWGVIAHLFNKLSIPFTFIMIFSWKFSSMIAILWIFSALCANFVQHHIISRAPRSFTFACYLSRDVALSGMAWAHMEDTFL